MEKIMKRFVFLLLCSLIVIQLKGCASVNEETQKEREARIQSSPQSQNGKFVNPNGVSTKLFSKETWEVTKEYIFGKRIDPKPPNELPVHRLHPGQWENHHAGQFSFSWLGHSSILISMENQRILIDPVLEERASPFSWIGPKRFHPSPVTAEELPGVDVVLITHDHYDHLEKSTLVSINEKVERFIVPLGIGELLEDWGINPTKITELDWWETYSSGSLKFHATPAVHYASRGLFDANQRLWCSWSIVGKEKRAFISGDSGYFDGFKNIGERLGPFDVTFLKIGAYNDKGTWRALHMTPEEAGQQCLDLRGQLLVPLHWATFDLGLHPWYEPIERLVTYFEQESVTLITPEVGEIINLRGKPNTDRWWLKYKNK
jgi:L-ascorbate metabolism protein UlaG (beta-lactamase superfamily)